MLEAMTSENMTHEKTARLNHDELREGWAEIGRVARLAASVKMGAKTDLGRVRDNNEDKFDFFEPEDPAVLATKGCFYAVADGMGGHSAGQIACEMALKTVIETYYSDPSADVEAGLRRAVEQANGLIWDTSRTIPDRQGMGTTLTAAVIREDRLTLVQVGDSRAYLLRDGAIAQLTEDHSWVAEQVRLGTMTLAEAQISPFRNIITRSIGTAATVEADIFTQDLRVGDTLLLCSDGLCGHLEPGELQAVLQEHSPSAAALALIEAANECGGRDNITALVLSVRALTPPEAASAHPSASTLGGVGAPEAPGIGGPAKEEKAKEEKTSLWGRRK